MRKQILWIFIILLIFLNSASAFSNNLNLTWVNEDNNSLLSPSVTCNGVSCDPTNSVTDYNTNSATVIVEAELTNYLNKSFTFGFPGDINLLYTVTMLGDTNAQNIQFEQRTETTEVKLTDFNILILDQNTGNLIGSFVNSGTSLFNVVLKPSGEDYNFMVTGSGITDFNYNKQEILINNIIDERTLLSLNSFGTVTVGGFGSFNYSQLIPNNIFTDNFTGANGDPPDSAIWDITRSTTNMDINIISNALYIAPVSTGGDSGVLGVQSDLNKTMDIGETVKMECDSVDRPTTTSGTHSIICGLYPDWTTNPRTGIAGGYSIERGSDGLIRYRANKTTGTLGTDETSGNVKFTIDLKRTGSATYTANYYINDTNLLATENVTDTNTLFKYFIWGETGSAGGAYTIGSVDNAEITKLTSSKLFPYTKNFYNINIDFNGSYFSRAYKRKFTKAASLTLQPYLADVANGVSTTITTIRSSNITTPISGIRIVTQKQIDGTEEMESVITDDKGVSIQSYLVGHSYILEFYDSDDILLFSKDIDATSSTLYVYISEGEIRLIHTTQEYVTVAFNPLGGRVYTTTTLRQTIAPVETTISQIDIVVENNDTNVFNTTYTVGVANGLTNTISAGSLGGDSNFSYEMSVYVFLTDGNVIIQKTTYTLPAGIDVFELIGPDTKLDLGCPSDGFCPILALASLLISLLVIVGAAATRPETGSTIYSILFLFVLGILTIIQWFPGELYAVMVMVILAIKVGSA